MLMQCAWTNKLVLQEWSKDFKIRELLTDIIASKHNESKIVKKKKNIKRKNKDIKNKKIEIILQHTDVIACESVLLNIDSIVAFWTFWLPT